MSPQNLIRFFSLNKQLCQRIPLIKFRAANKLQHTSKTPLPNVQSAGSSELKKSTSKAGTARAGPLIEDYQLPLRYRRSAPDQKEIDYINRGGPE